MKSCSLLLLLAVAVAVFPGPCVAKPHRHRHSHAKTQHKSRLSGTVTHRHRARELDATTDAAYTLQFALLADDNSPDCIESSVSVELSYRVPNGRWETLCSFTRAPGDCSVDREVVPLPQDIDQGMVQFRWLQQEQALGTCNCWQIDEVVITDAEEDRVLSFSAFQGSSGSLDDGFVCYHYGASAGQLGCLDNEGLVFCNGSASVPRGVVTPMYDLSTGDEVSVSCTASDLFEPVGDVEFCATDGTEETFIDIRFQLSFHDNVDLGDTRVCDALESFDEGVELAIRRSEDEQWVPLKFYTLSRFTEGRDEQIDIGNYDQESSILSLRGYNVSVVAGDTSVMSVTECISDERFFQEGTQFRWLQTVIRDRRTVRDTWYIDNVEIAVHRRQNSRTEFFDNFSDRSSINTTLWPQVRNGELGGANAGTGVGTVSDCVPESEIVLFFGATDIIADTSVIRRAMSRMAVTKPLDLVPEIDECAEGLDGCDENAVCTDTDQSFTCACRSGYTGDGAVCTNIDECAEGLHNCDMNADCTDTDGSFTCSCRDGYSGTGTVCTNIDECSEESDSCDANAICADTVGGFICTCQDGFRGDGQSCANIDECSENLHNCDMNADCTDTDGSFTCTCRDGFEGDGTFCTNINECSSMDLHNCDANADCTDTDGSFFCTCREGFQGDGQSCANVNECAGSLHSCDLNADCTDTDGSFTCTCREGFEGTGTVCNNINECSEELTSCDVNAVCIDSVGSFICRCRVGFRGDGFTCTNIDECSEGLHFCNVNADCVNTVGSFTCTCREGFEGNGVICTSQEASVAAEALTDLFNSTAEAPPLEIISSLRDVLGGLSEGTTFPPNISRLVFDSVGDLIGTVRESDGDGDDNATVGSSLLDVMDSFALGPYDPELGELEDNDNIALVHMIQGAMPDDDPSEMVEGITRDGNTIMLPREVFMRFNMTNMPVASFFYRNLSGLLPDSIPSSQSNTTMRLASPILSSALQCGPAQCNTRDLNLTNPVVLIFSHPPELMQAMQDGSVMCVFWEFANSEGSNGQWSTEGCTRNDTASNEFQTVCECNHLTHFALLLSTTEITLTSAEALSLRIIGIICVTISLVCLTATILTFVFLRSLWSMRSYIHINLCVSLFVAQLTFIVAVEPRGSVAGCQAVAVLLHYFFLVTFMWMLMEGVVLYVALVRVFIKFQSRYLIAFTLASYGIPLLYLCITVPLGFALDNGPHYAGDDPQSCWLRYDTHFIWAFIAPVIVIILANIGFFIMAITIMYRHQRRQTHKSKMANFKHWLKASISLVIVMGITWIIGILVFNRDLLFVAYIYTIFIGLQGLIIFILFVVLSKQVREAYTKWWKVKLSSSDFLSRHFGEKSFASHTASTALGTTINRNTSLKSKSQGTHISPSPSPDLTDDGRIGTLRRESKEEGHVFNVTFIKGMTSFGLTPVPIGDAEGGDAEEGDVEAALANGSVPRLEEEGGWTHGESEDIRTSEPDEITEL